MAPESVEQVILSIECSNGNGSIAMLRGATLLASSSNADQPSRAEETIRVIDKVLENADLTLEEIDTVVVSTGPGSYSGIRIGMATAFGLANAIAKNCTGVSVLDGLAFGIAREGRVTTAVAVGKRHTAWCLYTVSDVDAAPEPISPPVLDSDDRFIAYLETDGSIPLVWSAELSLRLADRLPADISASIPDKPIAELIVAFAARFPNRTSLTPQYLRDQQTNTG